MSLSKHQQRCEALLEVDIPEHAVLRCGLRAGHPGDHQSWELDPAVWGWDETGDAYWGTE